MNKKKVLKNSVYENATSAEIKPKVNALESIAFVQNKNLKVILIERISTPLGLMFAGSTDEGICFLEFSDTERIETKLVRLKKNLQYEFQTGESIFLSELKKQLAEYFNLQRKYFDLPLVISGTGFQKCAWKVLQKIPYGQTISYEHQATEVGNFKAVRAVANANGNNRISIIIPCHRVIGKNGDLTGYAGGLERKKYLLNLEKSNIKGASENLNL
jgi:AraC family transcriptional regulator of adaptative response/methylated-DNA-[protein]-cysteine methyltransferase